MYVRALNSDDYRSPINQYCNRWPDYSSISLGCVLENSAQQVSRYVHIGFCASITRPPGYQIPQDEDDPHLKIPERKCPQGCVLLFVSAIIYAVLFGITVLGMASALLCSLCRTRRPTSVSEQLRVEHAEREMELAEQPIRPEDTPITVDAAIAAVDSEEHSVADVVVQPPPFTGVDAPPPHAATLRDQCVVVGHHLRRLAILLYRLSISLFHIILHGTRTVRPWWRHALLVFGFIVLCGLSILSFICLISLVDANCRDFMISAIVNACVTFVLVIAGGNLILANRQRLMKRDENPFEAVGLLQMESEDEGTGDA